jgi:hypothetical protein
LTYEVSDMGAVSTGRKSCKTWLSRACVVLGAAAALVMPGALPAAAAPAPVGPQWPRVAVSTTPTRFLDMYYRGAEGELWHLQDRGSGWYGWENLGGRLTSSPAAVTIGSTPGHSWVFVVGTDQAIWYRERSGDGALWGPWRSAGGRSASNVPAATGNTTTGRPAVYTQGTDGNIWWRELGTAGWHPLGGVIAKTPAAVPPVAGLCPPRPDVFALGSDNAVYEYRNGGWQRIGGWSYDAPSAVRLSSGETDLFVQGRDQALWMNTRRPGATSWSGWRKVGGIITTAPAAQVWPVSPETRTVFARGADGHVWRGRNVLGSTAWIWTRVF